MIALAGLALSQAARAQLVFEIEKGPTFLAVETANPVTAMYDTTVPAAATWSRIFHNPVTLKYKLEVPGTRRRACWRRPQRTSPHPT